MQDLGIDNLRKFSIITGEASATWRQQNKKFHLALSLR